MIGISKNKSPRFGSETHAAFSENGLCDMKVDSEVMFECLMYINAYYYPVFATCESIMALAKYITPQRDTPNIGQDAAVCFTRLSVEILKLVVFYRYKHGRKSKYKLYTAIFRNKESVLFAWVNLVFPENSKQSSHFSISET